MSAVVETIGERRHSEPSERGWLIAEFVDELPTEWGCQLHRLLSHHLHAPHSAELREFRLGLIVELVLTTGELPAWYDYDRERAARKQLGEAWPDRTTIAEHFGGWQPALQAALDLYSVGYRVPHSTKHLRVPPWAYSRGEIESGIIDCARNLGHWPAKQEFVEWGDLKRRVRRSFGQPMRFPSMKAIRNRYGRAGGYERALRCAQVRAARANADHADTSRANRASQRRPKRKQRID